MKKVKMQPPQNKTATTAPIELKLVESVISQLTEAMDALQKLEPQVAAHKAVVETIVHTALAQAGHDIKSVKGVSLDKEKALLTFTL